MLSFLADNVDRLSYRKNVGF